MTLQRSHFASLALIMLQCALGVGLIQRYGPTVDEPAHLAAGLAVVSLGRFDLYPVNPPLVKAVAALPLLLSDVQTDWSVWRDFTADHRSEWTVGKQLLLMNRENAPRLLILARLAVLPLVLVGGVACFLWGRDLAGPGAGLTAQTLWTFCPNILGNGALITPDAAAASLGVIAGYAYWRWLERPVWPRSVTAGLTLGLVLLTKFTWLVLVPPCPFLWLIRRRFALPEESRPSLMAEAGQLSTLMGIALLVIHAGYGFDRPLWRLETPTFVSVSLAGDDSTADGGAGGNRFRHTWLGKLPVPLPQMFVKGGDLQKLDFDEGRMSYMAGTWRFGGWHEFYFYAALVKLPLGTLGLISLPFFAMLKGPAVRWLPVVLPGLAVFILVSSETGFTRFFRYVLPALPFALVWAGRSAMLATNLAGKLVVGGCLIATAASSLWVWPHSLSYFNEAAGGPADGWKHLLDANVDWGQDLPALAEWQRQHSEAKPLYLATHELLVPEIYGLKYERASSWPKPGWYAVGLTELHKPGSSVTWLREHEPIVRIGYSILLFHVPGERSSVELERSP